MMYSTSQDYPDAYYLLINGTPPEVKYGFIPSILPFELSIAILAKRTPSVLLNLLLYYVISTAYPPLQARDHPQLDSTAYNKKPMHRLCSPPLLSERSAPYRAIYYIVDLGIEQSMPSWLVAEMKFGPILLCVSSTTIFAIVVKW
jgi:hypothetical protein